MIVIITFDTDYSKNPHTQRRQNAKIIVRDHFQNFGAHLSFK